MKNLIRKFSLILALVLCLSCCAGFASAETAAEPSGNMMEMFIALLQQVPGMEDIDWVGFAEEFAAKKASGAEITLEDCLPAGAWSAFGKLQFMDENGNIPEDTGMDTDLQVTGNEMVSIYKLKEQASEEDAKLIAQSVAASFEDPASLLNMKTSIEQMGEGGINLDEVKMTLRVVNADDSVIYEYTVTYADVKDLEAVAAE